MASKKREIQLQAVINNQSLWDEMLQNKGLTVIDVYQAWCGPCKAMQTLFRKLKNEVNEDEILHFAVAEADSIVTLQPFRDKCEPVFLFSVNGKIVAKIKGANAPLVNQKIITLINEERKIAAGEMVRPQYHEVAFVDSDAEDAGEAAYESVEQVYSIVIIKPDAVVASKVLEIKDKIINAQFVIEAEDKRLLTEEQVKYFYSQLADQPDFEDFVSFMTSGLSYILVISQGKEQQPPWDKSDPNSEAEPKEPLDDQQETARAMGMMQKLERIKGKLPNKQLATVSNYILDFNSLQEYLERQNISQFCDVEENITNTKFIDVFFPDFKRMKSIKVEKILALLRPALFHERKASARTILDKFTTDLQIAKIQLLNSLSSIHSSWHLKLIMWAFYLEAVLNIIEDEGFKILMQRQIVLSREEAETLCKEHENKDYFESLIENMTSLCVQFAMEGLPVNQLHGSDSLEAARREIKYFFPPQNTIALIKPHVTQEQREYILKLIKEAGFDISQMKEMLLTEEQAEKVYFKIRGKDFYKDVLEILSEGPSLIMILTKWNAVSDWRQLMGPIDPEEAKLLSPDSIRAQFGRSILKNAVHGASNVQEAMDTINRMFEEFVAENPEEN
ncbi:Thioredoxin domain-containing protein 3 [Camelus dromedarius]|uniref:Thioredoxin domain-containing protein 3 n=1 Tax=Camelus dromedarius TaxID=9838 RepID=A0A5N4DYQ2_CAMDR|nr:Thioredoxin domain-containing protein 3 [Camelus dromedarius]